MYDGALLLLSSITVPHTHAHVCSYISELLRKASTLCCKQKKIC